ncbi:hypothetical protein IV38_GL000410 [Lactobacillus selangorensis]|uniref:Endoribonuclease YbeY n=1 Tax=Lactobacillus selangorensis TaxID=81857 RepID=A0A0R2FT27_9LACO|nr:rRNA maturation RNase YbeY [Lactobacillus selangorensis]KRN29525.1 hypothetical protein IV38_GL000410 [Lactobacillus selangorensis]KRN33945.1 hypothetical protein IV40_GL000258 [Lactobacillus selangorensis]
MDIEIVDETKQVDEAHLKMAHDLLEFAGSYMKLAADTEMSVTFVSDDKIHQINLEYRQTDRATDVISFAIEEETAEEGLPKNFEELYHIPKDIGDLIISPATVKEHAERYGHSFDREFGYTLVHGFLHLNGYDHIKPEDEAVMIPLQEKILDAYGLKR